MRTAGTPQARKTGHIGRSACFADPTPNVAAQSSRLLRPSSVGSSHFPNSIAGKANVLRVQHSLARSEF